MGSLTTIPACDGRTNGQTSCHGIVRATHTRRGVKIIGSSWNFVHSSKFWTRRTSHDKKLLKSCIGQTPSSTERISCSLTKFVERIMSRMSIKSRSRQVVSYYGRPLSVAWAKSMLYFANVILFIYFLWPPYAPVQVNWGSRNFYTWWTLSVNREVTTWIFSWSSLNYRMGQNVTKFGIFSDPARKLSALMPERGRIL